jgi:hypothetical protein
MTELITVLHHRLPQSARASALHRGWPGTAAVQGSRLNH